MSFKTNIFKSHTVRQLAGASIGMIVAGGLYVGFEQLGNLKLAGMLVQPNTTISENADQIATSHTEVDQDTARRLGQHAQAVADQMKQYAAVVQPVVPATQLEQHTQERLVARQQQLSQFDTSQTVHAAAPVYAGNSGQPVDQLTRLAQRAEANRQLRESTLAANIAAKTAPAPVDLAELVKAVKENPALAAAPSSAAAVTTVASADQPAMHSGAPLMEKPVVNPPKAKRLTSSGARENLLVILALAACAGMYLSDPLRRARMLALVTR